MCLSSGGDSAIIGQKEVGSVFRTCKLYPNSHRHTQTHTDTHTRTLAHRHTHTIMHALVHSSSRRINTYTHPVTVCTYTTNPTMMLHQRCIRIMRVHFYIHVRVCTVHFGSSPLGRQSMTSIYVMQSFQAQGAFLFTFGGRQMGEMCGARSTLLFNRMTATSYLGGNKFVINPFLPDCKTTFPDFLLHFSMLFFNF